MNRIEEYVDSIFKEIDSRNKKVADLKAEIRLHLLESVKELQAEGMTEDESITLAIERFGDARKFIGGVSRVYGVSRKFTRRIFYAALGFLIASLLGFFGFYTAASMYSYAEQEMFHDFLSMMAKNSKLNENLKAKITSKLDKYQSVFGYRYLCIYDNSKRNNNISMTDHLYKSVYLYPLNKTKEDIAWETPSSGSFTSYQENTHWAIGFQYKGEYYYKTFEKFSYGSFLVCFLIYWTLFAVWAMLKVYHEGTLNPGWVFVFILLNFVGYLFYTLMQRWVRKRQKEWVYA